MNVETAERFWELEYKPSIQLLIDNGESSYRPALILMFCAIEHAYRAIHAIPEHEPCIHDAICWTWPLPFSDEVREIVPENWRARFARMSETAIKMRVALFNSLKHFGKERDTVQISEDHKAEGAPMLTLGIIYLLLDGKRIEESRVETFNIPSLWRWTRSHLDIKYEAAVESTIVSGES